MSIRKEAWYKVAAGSLDRQLSSLLRDLNDGRISPIEYAKLVLRMHGHGGDGEGKDLLYKLDGNLLVTSEWLQAHKQDVEELQDLAKDIYHLTMAASTYPSPAWRSVDRWLGWSSDRDTSTRVEIHTLSRAVKERFRLGAVAALLVITGSGLQVYESPSEEDLNDSIPPLLNGMRGIRDTLSSALPWVLRK